MKIGLLLTIVLGVACLLGCQSQTRPIKWAEPLDFRVGPENFYRVNSNLYRSARPNAKQMSQFEAVKGRSVLYLGDEEPLELPTNRSKLQLFQVTCSPNNMTEAQLINSLVMIRQAPKPLLICDRRGADAVGAVVAAYRIVFDQWTPKEAKLEMKNGGYGFSSWLYPNLTTLIDSTDWDRVKDRVLCSESQLKKRVEKSEAVVINDAVVGEEATPGSMTDVADSKAQDTQGVAVNSTVVEPVAVNSIEAISEEVPSEEEVKEVETETQGNK